MTANSSSPLTLALLYVHFMDILSVAHRRRRDFLFGSFSFVDAGGIVEFQGSACLSREGVRGWDRRLETPSPQGSIEARGRDTSRLLSRWSAVKTEHYRGHEARMYKSGQAATKTLVKGF